MFQVFVEPTQHHEEIHRNLSFTAIFCARVAGPHDWWPAQGECGIRVAEESKVNSALVSRFTKNPEIIGRGSKNRAKIGHPARYHFQETCNSSPSK